MNSGVGDIWRARTFSTVGTQEPISTLPSFRSITLKSRTSHQKAASLSGSWQSTANSVNLPRRQPCASQPHLCDDCQSRAVAAQPQAEADEHERQEQERRRQEAEATQAGRAEGRRLAFPLPYLSR